MATQRQKERKKRTLARLEQSLTSGKKPLRVESKRKDKGYKTSNIETVAHTEQDKKRISTEITNLKIKLGLAV